jgi:hypothetical protein
MATFWKEFSWFGPKNGAQWFGEPRCKLGSKVVLPLVFITFHYFSPFSLFFKVFFSLVLEVEIMHKWRHFMDGGGHC